MSLLMKPGITRLSELIIDADKDWLDYGITNIRQIAQAMAIGDIVVRGPDILQRIAPGTMGHVLTSGGPGHIPAWLPVPEELEYYIPVWIFLNHYQAILLVDKSHSKSISVGSEHVQAYEDAPEDNIRRLDREIALADSEDIVAVDKEVVEEHEIKSECAIENPVGGAVLEDDGVMTDYTADINDDTTTSPLLPAVGDMKVDDAKYFGFEEKWDQLRLDIHAGASGNYMLVDEYWDGSEWKALTILREGTGEFRKAGANFVKWDIPTDWEKKTIEGKELYWMRFRVAGLIDYSVQPTGRQGWCEVLV